VRVRHDGEDLDLVQVEIRRLVLHVAWVMPAGVSRARANLEVFGETVAELLCGLDLGEVVAALVTAQKSRLPGRLSPLLAAARKFPDVKEVQERAACAAFESAYLKPKPNNVLDVAAFAADGFLRFTDSLTLRNTFACMLALAFAEATAQEVQTRPAFCSVLIDAAAAFIASAGAVSGHALALQLPRINFASETLFHAVRFSPNWRSHLLRHLPVCRRHLERCAWFAEAPHLQPFQMLVSEFPTLGNIHQA